MDIKVNKNENLSLAIKKALVNEGAKQESFTASVWNKILDLVDAQNQENKANGKKALYSGGKTRKPADWKHNYKVFANQVLNFSESTWNNIRSIVGLDAKETVAEKSVVIKVPEITVEQLSKENQFFKTSSIDLTKIPKFGLEDISINQTEFQQAELSDTEKGADLTKISEVVEEDTSVSQTELQSIEPRASKKGVEPDDMISKAKNDIPADNVDEMSVLKPNIESPVQKNIKDNTVAKSEKNRESEQIEQEEQVVAQNQISKQKIKKTKTKKQKVAKPVVEEKSVENADGSITMIKTTKNSDNSSEILEENNKPNGNLIITTRKQTNISADGRTVIVKTSRSSASKEDVENNRIYFSDNLGGSEVITTTNEDGTKNISFTITPSGNIYNSSKIQKCTYSIDENGNVFSNLKNGGKVTISQNTQSHYWGKETEIKITDKDGKETFIPLRIKDNVSDVDNISGLELVEGSLVSAISGLSEDALKDFKIELSAIETNKEYFYMHDNHSGIYKNNDTIAMSIDGGYTSRTLTHELGHALDDSASNKMQSDENKQVFDDLIKLIKDKNFVFINNCYALTDNMEFFAEYYAHKEGYGLVDDKELFDKLENTQDKELKAAYEKVKAVCDNIINETRNKPQTERVNIARQEKDKKNNAESEFIKEHRAEIENIFGKEASSSITSDNDFIKLYYQNSYLGGKKNEAEELLNALFDVRPDLLE